MNKPSAADGLLISRIRDGDDEAWTELVARYEGRLLAFAESRLGRRSVCEDVVQETFVGFLNSLPNYDGERSLESYLFSICAYKLTDQLRRAGRRPTLPLSSATDSSGEWPVPAADRPASSLARSGERRALEHQALSASLHEIVTRWKERGDWLKLQCIELLIVRGWTNKDTATALDITEQQVANFKFDFLARLRTLTRRQNVSPDVFPEIYRDEPR